MKLSTSSARWAVDTLLRFLIHLANWHYYVIRQGVGWVKYVDRTISTAVRTVFEELLDTIYQWLPTQEGEFDERLQEEVTRALLFWGARFRTFNRSFGWFVGMGTILFFASFTLLFGLVAVSLGTSVSMAILNTGAIIPVIGLMVALFLFAIANLLLLLYLGAVIRFVIQRIRSSVEVTHDGDPEVYEFRVRGRVEDEPTQSSSYTIHQSNLRAFTRILVYSIFFLIDLVCLVGFLVVPGYVSGIPVDLPTGDVAQTWLIAELDKVVTAIDLLLPFELAKLFTPANIQSLLLIGALLFGFKVFLEAKKITQHAELSKYSVSDYSEFTWGGEQSRYTLLLQVLLYQLLHGELRDDYELIRGDIVGAGVLIILNVVISYMLTVLFLTGML